MTNASERKMGSAACVSLLLLLAFTIPSGTSALSLSNVRDKLAEVLQYLSVAEADVPADTLRSLCIPKTSSLLEHHEGRHKCAYNTTRGHRAVGVGYVLDRDVDAKKKELATVIADYDRVYKGEVCLNDLQINALLAFDAKRALDVAAEHVPTLDDQCCNVQAVFGDLVHAVAGDMRKLTKGEEWKTLVEKMSAHHWEEAAEVLLRLSVCEERSLESRCRYDAKKLRHGCSSSDSGEAGDTGNKDDDDDEDDDEDDDDGEDNVHGDGASDSATDSEADVLQL